jgi:hypothetical protein
MKKLLLLLVMAFSVASLAQVPQGVSYQAIALNSSGYPVGNTLIGVRLSILDNSVTGTVIYTETHTTTTNDRGLYNLVIGQGTPVSGLFPSIDWGTNYKFLKVELDIAGGTNYVLAGTTQLWSVPYALYAEKANSVNVEDIVGEIDNVSDASAFITDNKAYYLYPTQGNPDWIEQTLSGVPIKIISSSSSVGVMTSTNAYVAVIDNNTSNVVWHSIALSGTPLKMVGSNQSIAVLTSTHAYVLSESRNSSNVSSYNWYTQALSGTARDIFGFGLGVGAFGVITDTNAYGFGITTFQQTPQLIPSWTSSGSLSGTVLKTRTNHQKLSIYTSSHAYSFLPLMNSQGTSVFEWKSIQMSGNYIESSK